MDININLLNQEKLKKSASPSLKKTFSVSLIVLIVLYIALVASIFSYSFYLSAKVKNYSEHIANLTSKADTLKQTEFAILHITSKISSLAEITSNKKEHHQIADFLFNILSPGISIEGFTIGKDNYLTFKGKAETLKSLKLFLDNLNANNDPNIVLKSVIFDNLSLTGTEDKFYGFSLTMQFFK